MRDLINFLTKQQSSFTPSDWQLLKSSAFLPGVVFKQRQTDTGKEIETFSDGRMRRPNELFFPSEDIKELGFPVLDWPKNDTLHHGSKQASLLRSIGLLEKPDLLSLFSLCASSKDLWMRDRLLNYMESNVEDLIRLEKNFNIMNVDVAFIPSKVDSKSKYPVGFGSRNVAETIGKLYLDIYGEVAENAGLPLMQGRAHSRLWPYI